MLILALNTICSVFSSMMNDVFKINKCHLIAKATKATFGLNNQTQNSVRYLPPDLAIKMLTKNRLHPTFGKVENEIMTLKS